MKGFLGVLAFCLATLGTVYWLTKGPPAKAAECALTPAADVVGDPASAAKFPALPGPNAALWSEPPLKIEAKFPKGSLHNPYGDGTNPKIAAEGRELFTSFGCSGCHGGNGGGGMCPPLDNGVWIYGGTDDTLFRLIALGSIKLQAAGYQRHAIENVVAPMPEMGLVVKSARDEWKIITFIRSIYDGPPGHKF